jgi:hypothetical protein
MGPDFSCRPDHARRLMGWLEEGAAIDFAYDELQQMRKLRAARPGLR